MGEHQQAGDEEDELAGEREEDALAGHADALEEVDGDHLESDDGEDGYHVAQAVGGLADELFVGGEGARHEVGDEDADEEGGGGDGGGGKDGEAQHAVDAVELAGAVVISGYGLHALVKAHHYHDEEEGDAVGYAVGSDGEVASVGLKAFVDEYDHDAGAEVHQEGGHADGEGVGDYLALEAEGAATDVYQLALVGEYLQLPAEGYHLGQHGGRGGSADAHVEDVDEDGGEDDVDEHGADGGVHGFLGMAGGAEHGVESQVHVGDDVAKEDDLHEVARIGEGGVAGTEEVEDGVDEGQHQGSEDDADDGVHGDDVAKDLLGGGVVLLSEFDGEQGGGTHAYHGAKGG